LLKYKIEKGKNHFKGVNIYRVKGINNEYLGEWNYSIIEANDELKNLIK